MTVKKTGAIKRYLIIAMLAALAIIIAAAAILVLHASESGRSKSETIADMGEDKLVSAFFDDHSAVVGFSSNKLVMTDPDGKELWSRETGGSVKGLAISEESGSIYAACEDGSVIRLDRDGNVVAEATLKGRAMDLYYVPAAGKVVVAHGVGVTSQKFYVTVLDEQLDSANTIQTFMDTYACAMTSDGETTFYGTKDSRVGAINAGGAVAWEVYSKYSVMDIALIESHKLLAVVDEKGYVYGISYEHGKTLWNDRIPDTVAVSVTADEKNAVIIVGDISGTLYAYDYEGNLLAKKQVGSGTINAVTVCATDNSLYGACGKALFVTGAFENQTAIEFAYKTLGMVLLVTGALAFIVLFFIFLYHQNQRAREIMQAIRRRKVAYFMLTPTFALLLVFVYYPIIRGFWGAFTNWSPFRETAFVGLQNFRRIGSDIYVWIGVKNMLLLTFTGLVKTMTMPLIAALLISHLASNKLKYLYRTGFVLTTIVPGVAASLMWKMMLDPNIGLINNVLRAVGQGQLARSWLGEEQLAIWSIIFIGFPWIGVFQFLVFYGGFMGIDPEIYDSSKIDGADALRRFFRIELPLITPQLKMLLLLGLIWGLQDYQGILLTTRGGPGRSTYVPALEVFFNVSEFGEYGYASAIGLMLFAFILIVSLTIMKIPTVDDD